MSLSLIDSMITRLDTTKVPAVGSPSEDEKLSVTSKSSSVESTLLNDLFVVKPEWIDHSDISKVDDSKFPELSNCSFIDTAFGRGSIDHIPIWIHRQAGRYLPEFKQTRAEVGDFFKCCQTPSVCCELTMQPIRRFDYDASIIFSDILVIPQVLGFEIEMIPGKGPTFTAPFYQEFCRHNTKTTDDGSIELLLDDGDDDISTIESRMRKRLTFSWMTEESSSLSSSSSKDDQRRLFDKVTHDLSYVYDAIGETRMSLDGKVPLIGFCGAPLTLLAYMCDGTGSKHSHNYSRTKALMYRFPKEAHFALKLISDCVIAHLIGQVVFGGAQSLELFESSCGEFSSKIFDDFCLPYLKYIKLSVDRSLSLLGLKECIPFVLFPRNVHYDGLKTIMDDLHFDVVAIDWGKSPLTVTRLADLTGQCAMMGNLDPWMLVKGASDEKIVRQKVFEMLDGFSANGSRKGRQIVNLGHGMMPNCDPNAVTWFIQAVRDYSEANQ